MGQPEGKLTGVGRCLHLELVGRRAAAADLREDKLHSPLAAGSAVGRVQEEKGEGEAMGRSRWVVMGRWTVMGKVQEQAQILMENLKTE